MAERPDELVTELLSGRADDWDRAGRLPADVIRELARAGLLCPDVPVDAGGRGLSSVELGEFTAHVGSLCSSVRSLLTSQGMAAWAVRRFGTAGQRADVQRRLATGAVAAVAFSEAEAGSDLAAMTTRIDADGDRVTVTGTKVWVTGAAYADLVLVVGRYGEAGAAVLVPTGAPGVRVTPVADPLGCRAAGHAEVALDGVELPVEQLLGGTGLPLEWLVTSVLAHGRLSVAWGCVGILRGCGAAAARHAAVRKQFGKPLAEHQLVARHLAELLVAESAATRMCRSRSARSSRPSTSPPPRRPGARPPRSRSSGRRRVRTGTSWPAATGTRS
jgi:methoxymalonate biosynthesis protein